MIIRIPVLVGHNPSEKIGTLEIRRPEFLPSGPNYSFEIGGRCVQYDLAPNGSKTITAFELLEVSLIIKPAKENIV